MTIKRMSLAQLKTIGDDLGIPLSDRDFGQPGEREIRSVEPVALRR